MFRKACLIALSIGVVILTIACATAEPAEPIEVTVIKEEIVEVTVEVEVTREVIVEIEVTREAEVIREVTAVPEDVAEETDMEEVVESSMSTEDQITNAMSAAPGPISLEATILGYPESWPGNYPDEVAPDRIMLQEGTNGWTCLVDRPDTPGNDPMCLNDVYLEVLNAQYNLTDSPSTGIGLGYMLQGGGPEGSAPHMMIFTPESNAAHSSFTSEPGPYPWVMFSETSHQHLMVLVTPPSDMIPATEDQIANAMSAGPAPISQDATILGYPESWPGDYPDGIAPDRIVLQEGTNGWTCLTARPDTPGNDPMCLNDVYLEVLNAQYDLADSPSSGIGFGYMLQGGGPVGSPPHIMVFAPESNDAHASFTTEPGPFPWVMFPETTHQHLMILTDG